MPRRDGHPTNQEMLADFTATSRKLLVDLYNTHAEFLGRTFEDKPLTFLRAQVVKRYFKEQRPPNSVEREELLLEPVSNDQLPDIKRTLQMRGYSPDVLDYYKSIAKNIAKVALKPGLDLDNNLPPNGVTAHYTAQYPHKYPRTVDTFAEKPVKQIIASAQYFADEAINFASTGETFLPLEERIKIARENNADGILLDDISIKMAPNLPLSGREGTAFLTRYCSTMYTKYRRLEEKAEANRHRYGHEFFKEMAARYKAAYMRAQTILDSRKDS